MPTVVVSGRVDEGVKLHADAIIRAAGSTVNGVINDVWQTIVSTCCCRRAGRKACRLCLVYGVVQ